MTTFEKIRTELHATAEMHEDGDYYLRDKWVDEIIDKYAEKEQTNTKLMLMEANIQGYTEGLKDSSKSETVTEFADRCRECGAKYGKLLKQKTGHWIWDVEKGYCKCSRCGIGMGHKEFDYCPNCGARMESEVR